MVKRCRQPFTVWNNGAPRVVAGGDLVDDNDPVIKGREHLFEDVATYMADRRTRVEQTTAEPGERRSLSRPSPSRKASKGSDGEA
jgi:hypothetical protein